MAADGHDPARHADDRAVRLHRVDIVMDFFVVVGPLESMSERQDPHFLQFVHLVHADSHLFSDIFFHCRCGSIILDFFGHSFHSLAAGSAAEALLMLTIL